MAPKLTVSTWAFFFFSFNGLQNFSAEEREDLTEQIRALRANEKLTDDQEKAFALGFMILNTMGEDFLRSLFGGDRRDQFLIDQTDAEHANESGDIAALVQSLFRGVRFQQAVVRLNEMTSIPADAQTKLKQKADKIAALDKSDQEKVFSLAYAVIDVVGVTEMEKHFKGLASQSAT